MLLLSIFAGCSDGTSPVAACDSDPVERWLDADGDGFGVGEPELVCEDAAGYATVALDCDDADSTVNPDAIEACNGRDDDCNGELDNGLDGVRFYTDADGDGFGVLYPAQVSCERPTDGWSRNADDCDDTNPDIHPDGTEVCNDGLDDDCNGVADDNDAGVDPGSRPTWYQDDDLDGYGNPEVVLERCRPLSGYVADRTDCDDRSRAVSPGAEELPGNGVDENCNLLEGCFDDLDDDGARTEIWSEVADRFCAQPGRAPESAPIDCDDNNPLLTVIVDWYEDLDNDGYGSGDVMATQCTDPGGGLVPESEPLDCDDEDPAHSPATVEICDDLIDQNCDLLADCEDPACAATADCLLPCADLVLDPSQTTVQGTTVGRGNNSTGNCLGGGNAPDVAFQWTAPADGIYTVDSQGSNYDTALYVRQGCVAQDLACNDDTFGLQSMVQFPATAGEVYVIVIDGFSNGSGNFVLNFY